MPLADRRPLLRGISSLLSPVAGKHVHIAVDLPPTPSAGSGMVFPARWSPSAACTPPNVASDGSQRQDVKLLNLQPCQTESSQSSQDSTPTPSQKLRLPTEVFTKRVRMNLPRPLDTTPQASPWGLTSQNQNRARAMMLMSPSSCASASRELRGHLLSPSTPDPMRNSLKLISGNAKVLVFDFDGTLTATPGELAQRPMKASELKARATLLEPRLRELRNSGFVLSIMSKSTEQTIRSALEDAGLLWLFDGPIMGKAVGFEGKAGFIEELAQSGRITTLKPEEIERVVLIDDDVRELDRARLRGIQTYAAPVAGGLQEADFDEIFASLGVVGPARPLEMMVSPR